MCDVFGKKSPGLNVRNSSTLSMFKRKLKTFLFDKFIKSNSLVYYFFICFLRFVRRLGHVVDVCVIRSSWCYINALLLLLLLLSLLLLLLLFSFFIGQTKTGLLTLTGNRQLANKHTNLHIASFSSTFHSASNVYCVTPNVIMWLLSADNSGYHGTLADS